MNLPASTLLHRYGKLYTPPQSRQLLEDLIATIDWQYDYLAFGRRFSVPRLQAWYADDGIYYRYSDNMLERRPWTAPLLNIKSLVENTTCCTFNSVLITYYRTGDDHVTWHADNEAELGESPSIASLSLGESRRFEYRNVKTRQIENMILDNGDLLLMQPEFQHQWEHCVPPDSDKTNPRINLTFRHVVLTRKDEV